MRELVTALCSDACEGRAPGTAGGRLARAHVIAALRSAGLDPYEQAIAMHGGANVLATIPGSNDRWVLVAAHYDHLGKTRDGIYAGADDNAAAVAILVEVAARLAARRPEGRGVIIAAFDAEEPPWFTTEGMGSEHFARHPIVPLERIDLMLCMDLVGHALGPEGAPDAVRDTLFALGAERSTGTGALIDELARTEAGVLVRRADATIVPPLSDYGAFWQRKVPFVFLTSGRSRTYHTIHDRPELLAWDKMAATARWLERVVRASCARDAAITFDDRTHDASTLRSLIDLTAELEPYAGEQAAAARAYAQTLLGACDREGRLPGPRAAEVPRLVALLESSLA